MADFLFPEGTYSAVAIETVDELGVCAFARFGYSTNGNNEVRVQFKLIDLPPGVSPPRFPFSWYGYFVNDKAAKRTAEALRYMGWTGGDIADAMTQKLDQVVEVVIRLDTYNGSTKAKIAFINEHGSGSGSGSVKFARPMPAAKLREFSAQMQRLTESVPECPGVRRDEPTGKPAGEPPVPAPGGSPEVYQDDIPF